jgi:hypothetical protein
MNIILVSAILISSILFISCNQDKDKSSSTDTTVKVDESESEFKDSISFKKDVKVFVKPITQILYIDSVTEVNGSSVFYIDGKKYKASDLQSLEPK